MEKQKCVMQGFTILRDMLASYIEHGLSLEYGSDNWWREGVIKILRDEQKRNLPQNGDTTTLTNSLDIANCLLLFDLHWKTIFQKKLSIDHRTWAKELVGFRNRMAHMGGVDFSDSDTWRALDTMSRLAEQIDHETTEKLHGLLRTFRYGSENGSTTMLSVSSTVSEKTKNTSGLPTYLPPHGLLSWREVIEPHPDVAQGRYKNAEFAADLAQVARGEGSPEYRDPVEFFARTFVTEGMTGLLTQALCRVCGKDGEPVIQLKTAFGGGKTHSMLALYHIMRGIVHVDKIPNVKPILERAGITTLPKTNVAVIVGTALDPTKSKRPKNMPGLTINTIWGEIAAQLTESTNNPKLYDFVREADRKGVSPGSETLKKLFDAAAPCLVLMDELVAYAKKLYGAKDLPAGTFDNFITFIQEVTEAAKASKNSLVVASIPESTIEIGGEAGKIALDAIEHTFGRMESIWKPVTANEGFEVVRRRLFLSCKNPNARDEVCVAFSRMYNENSTDFPIETKELDYKKRMISCYPIHPEIFDELYTNWSTLERFQRTRGVLRLMAVVVYDLWMNNDTSLMIMPGSIPLAVPNVRDELTRHLSDNWNGIVDKEVDGKDSIPYKIDEKERRYGKQCAARRVARTIMLGSAPTGREQTIRGIETSRIRLGIVQPGENIAEFNDALNTLRNTLTYLYPNSSGDRYWYDSRQTLRKTAEDRTKQIVSTDIEYEIEKRLHKLSKEHPFAGIHICPASSLDVLDDQNARLVILRPIAEHRSNNLNSNAMKIITDILTNRGNTSRIYRNMLAFIAPDQDLLTSLKQAVSWYLAWKSIKDDREELNLDPAQNRETDNNITRSNETVDTQLKEVYCWLFVPHIDRVVDIKTIMWDTIRISGGTESIIAKAKKKMLQDEALISQWAPSLLLMTLNDVLWRDSNHISIKQLWEHLCTYCYLPRLINEKVLEDTIRRGVNSTEYFAYAVGFDGTRYIDLKFTQQINIIEHSGYLVKVNVAQKQLTDEATRRQAEITIQTRNNTLTDKPLITDDTTTTNYPLPTTAETNSTVETAKKSHFYMSAQLDTTRIGRDVQKLVEEIINHLTSVDDTQVDVTLELNAKSLNGLPKEVVRTILENCKTLRIKDYGCYE
jgi:predicted AAA+ superfamily ATPase